jgi:hypothetical protein
MSHLQTNDTNVPHNSGAKPYSSKFAANALLIGGAIAVLLATAGWLYFLGWLAGQIFTWFLTWVTS